MKLKNCLKITSVVLGILVVIFTSCRKDPVLAPGTKQVCFDSIVMPIIKSNCSMSGCHGSGGESPILLSYDDVKAIVKAGDPNNSKLYNVITAKGFVLTSMPPKPRPQLNVQQINDITIWILQGADNIPCP